MITMFINQLKNYSHSRWYWGMALVAGITLLSVALFFQHVLGERPCLLCIQVRIWVTLFVVASFVGLLVRQNRMMNSIAHLSIVLIALGLAERSYQLLGTERGFIFGDCGFDLGLPTWFLIDQWLPSVFYVETACGYTPELVFGITMAEALMVFSVSLLLVSIAVSVASFLKRST